MKILNQTNGLAHLLHSTKTKMSDSDSGDEMRKLMLTMELVGSWKPLRSR
jgi:hypothetical protein